MARSLTSDQVNYLIWRYFQESGFAQSAYSFQRESKADKNHEVFGPTIATGSLIYLIHRGLQYVELAAQVAKDGTIRRTSEPFLYFPASTTAQHEDEGVVTERRHAIDEDEENDEEEEEDESLLAARSPAASIATTIQTNNSRKHAREDHGANGVSTHPPEKKRRKKVPPVDVEPIIDGFVDGTPGPLDEPSTRCTNGCSVGVQVEDLVVEITEADSLLLGPEDGSVTACVWCPTDSTILATAYPDAIARLWDLPHNTTSSSTPRSNVLTHSTAQRDVIALEWSPKGDLLATGCYDGQSRIWYMDGGLKLTLSLHYGPVLRLKWNKSATALLSLSCDGKVVAHDTNTGEPIMVWFEDSKEVALDIEWSSDTEFFASGNKGSVFRYSKTSEIPLCTNVGHLGEVNCITWDEVTERLASGGEDGVIQIYHNPTTSNALSTALKGHTDIITALSWQPIPPHTPLKRIIASASNDTSIRIWEIFSRSCLHILSLHSDPIERISFSPDGTRLASGANGKVMIWRTSTGSVTHAFDAMKGRRTNGRVMNNGDTATTTATALTTAEDGEITEVSWDEKGSRLAVAAGGRGVRVFGVGAL